MSPSSIGTNAEENDHFITLENVVVEVVGGEGDDGVEVDEGHASLQECIRNGYQE
jgi:hypothetical protein